MGKDWYSLRKQYGRGRLDESLVDPNPIAQLEGWVGDALAARCPEPTAMVLSTAGSGGKPSSRALLMKGLDAGGILFFTNYESRKGLELAANPSASLLFFWPGLERQVRVEGTVFRTEPAESDAYFRSRPLESRLSAIISPQSREVPDRLWLEQKRSQEGQRAQAEQGIRPPHWGGCRLVPDYFEFWQGRADRLHDRVCYEKAGAGWRIFRLAP
ncbi:MAG: pyridoxamine 5'-phosphate oxidase [Bacteroidales bacterium]